MSILKEYRPSSALQAMFSEYHGVFSVCLQELDMDLFKSAFVKMGLV